MRLYRPVLVELRRTYRAAPWVLAAVVVGELWVPADPVVEPASTRLREAGYVVELPLIDAIAAADDDEARAIGLALALALGLAPTFPHERSRHRTSVQMRFDNMRDAW